MFSYEIVLTCWILGLEFEFHKTMTSRVQLRAGDCLNLDILEEVRIHHVVWHLCDLDESPQAFVQLETLKLEGKPIDWVGIMREMDYSIPELVKTKETNPSND